MFGRDVLLFGLMGVEPFRIQSLPIPCPDEWTRRCSRNGLLQKTSRFHVQVVDRAFAEACSALADEFPRFDTMCSKPTEIEVMASLPHRFAGIATYTAVTERERQALAFRKLVSYGWVSQEGHGCHALVAPKSVQDFVNAYRALYHAVPAGVQGTDAACIHQRGVEAAWGITLADGKRAVCYYGPRRLHALDQVLLRWRLQMDLAVGQELESATKVSRTMLEEVAVRFPLGVVKSLSFRDRLELYGFGALHKSLMEASDEFRFAQSTRSTPVGLGGRLNVAPFEDQRQVRWIP